MFLEPLYFSKSLYFLALLILTAGLFIMLSSDNYVRKIVGLNIMQSSVLIFYLILGKVNGGIVPIARSSDNYIETTQQTKDSAPAPARSRDKKILILNSKDQTNTSVQPTLSSRNTKNIANSSYNYQYSSPVPQVLMLTAIVVGFATLSVGLALISLISKQFATISESQIHFTEIEGE